MGSRYSRLVIQRVTKVKSRVASFTPVFDVLSRPSGAGHLLESSYFRVGRSVIFTIPLRLFVGSI